MERILAAQKKAFIDNGPPSLKERTRRIDLAIALLVDNADALAEAVSEDFGGRPVQLTKLADIMSSVEALKGARAAMPTWTAGDKRYVAFPMNYAGARNTLEYQPKGVIGIIAPWNYPISLLFSPMAQAFAAGNSVMLKPSEFTPRTAELVASLCTKAFDETVVALVTGGADVAAAFSALPFDHLLYTGSTSVGKHVARAAAENLTPLTLELGGKCPCILSRTADLAVSARRIANGKTMNAGQTCVAPDYLFLPKARHRPIS